MLANKLCATEQLSSASTLPGQQPGYSWREVTVRRQQSSQSTSRGSIARTLSYPDVTAVTSPLPGNDDAAQQAAGATSDAANHAA